MALEQYIVRELRQDIKLLINKVTELEQKLEETHIIHQNHHKTFIKLYIEAEESFKTIIKILNDRDLK